VRNPAVRAAHIAAVESAVEGILDLCRGNTGCQARLSIWSVLRQARLAESKGYPQGNRAASWTCAAATPAARYGSLACVNGRRMDYYRVGRCGTELHSGVCRTYWVSQGAEAGAYIVVISCTDFSCTDSQRMLLHVPRQVSARGATR